MAEFGAAIRKSLPKEREDEYSEGDLVLGFNNLVIPLEAIEERLEDSVFRNRAVLAVGKAEWESMSWNDKSIALKNSGKLVFTAAADLDAYHWARSSEPTFPVSCGRCTTISERHQSYLRPSDIGTSGCRHLSSQVRWVVRGGP